jgi:hypothetical protein
MKAFVCLCAFLSMTGAALAQGRPSTTSMTCAAAASLVQQRGAVVLGTGGSTFDRAVRDASFCAQGQKLRPMFAPTTDNPNCHVGWRCFDESRESR